MLGADHGDDDVLDDALGDGHHAGLVRMQRGHATAAVATGVHLTLSALGICHAVSIGRDNGASPEPR